MEITVKWYKRYNWNLILTLTLMDTDFTQKIPSVSDIRKAYDKIKSNIHRTPVMSNRQVNERCGAEILFKCENFQRVGAFKVRGGCNAVFSLTDKEAEKGVATHSSGNHAQGVALAAKIRGIPAHIVMPEDAPEIKKKAVLGYGADITYSDSTVESRRSTLEQVVNKTGATFIHPYNDPHIISGQGTAALEFLEDYPDLDYLLAPVGGGGLVSGTAIYASGEERDIKVIACEPELADDAYQSFNTGILQPARKPVTIADGLRTSLGELTFACVRKYVDDIVLVNEEEIVEAMRFIWERMNIIIEASSAVPVAALFNDKIEVNGKRVGVILSGGNTDLDNLPWN